MALQKVIEKSLPANFFLYWHYLDCHFRKLESNLLKIQRYYSKNNLRSLITRIANPSYGGMIVFLPNRGNLQTPCTAAMAFCIDSKHEDAFYVVGCFRRRILITNQNLP